MRIAIALLVLGLLSFAAAGGYEREYRYDKGKGKDKGDKDAHPDKDDKYCKYDPKEDAGTADWDLIRQEIINEVILKDGKIDRIAPALVRLGFHLGGTFDKNAAREGRPIGGSNGATIRFPPEKDWLPNGRSIVAPQEALQGIKDRHPEVTYADLWTFASVVALETMGSNPIPWKPGRVDYNEEDTRLIPNEPAFDPANPNGLPLAGRLPVADQNAAQIRPIFERMGLDDQKTVCVLGAHTLGGAQPENTLRSGTWTRTPFQFTNMFFKHLLEEKWIPDPEPDFTEVQFTNKGLQDLMMFHSDLALVQDKRYKYWVEKYAADEQLFFKDFSKCFGELLELGVPRPDYEKEGASWKGKGTDKCTCKAKWEPEEPEEDKDHCYRCCSKYDGDDKEVLKCKCKCQEKGQRKDCGKDKSYEKRKSHKGYCNDKDEKEYEHEHKDKNKGHKRKYKNEKEYDHGHKDKNKGYGKDVLKCKCKCQEKGQHKDYGNDKYEKDEKEYGYNHKDKNKGHKRKYNDKDEKEYEYDHKDKNKGHKRKYNDKDKKEYEYDHKDKNKGHKRKYNDKDKKE